MGHLRPQLFKEFNQILKSDGMNHAYLFSGDFASFDLALHLVKDRFCENLQDSLSCGECREYRLIAENEFSGVRIVKPNGQVIRTDTIRELIYDFSRSDFEDKSQVFIAQDYEKIHVNAANSLLKFIEELQSSSYMILLTSDENKVLPTIKSRTQILCFPKNKPLLVKQAEKVGVLKTQAGILTELTKTLEHLDELVRDKKISDVIQACERFATVLFKEKMLAYLETGRLVQVTLEKFDREFILQLLPLFLARRFNQKKSLVYLEESYKA